MAAKKTPPMTEISISYSLGIKANIAKFENADAHISRSERYDVSDMTAKQIDAFYHERYQALKNDLGPLIEAEYEEFHS